MKKVFTSSRALWSCLVVMMMMAAQSAWAEYVPLTALDGKLSYGQTSIGKETYDKLVDMKIDTKWGGWFDPSLSDEESWPNNTDNSANVMYIIIKAEKAVVPDFYFLVTANDTGSHTERNWASWKIYGGNFESDELAVRGGDGWALIDERVDEPMPEASFEPVDFDFNKNPTTAYQYFWIELEKTVANADVYQQMAEFGLGTYADLEAYLKYLEELGTGTDEPVNYYQLANSGGYDNEGAANLFDGDSTTKWCYGFTGRNKGETSNGAYVIFKASRPMAPAYYILTTANDTGSWSGRNWKQWQIYGINAVDESEVTRESDNWVLLDDKANVPTGTGMNELPAANYMSSFFTLSEANETEYRYFKIEIDQIVSGGTIQMADIALGDQYTVVLDREDIAATAESNFNPDVFAEKALLDQMEATIAEVKTCTDPVRLGELRAAVDNLTDEINASAANYAELITAANQAANAIAGGELSEEAVAYLTAWAGETVIAPGEGYPVGNLAYIKANRQITGAQALKEANRINSYIINSSAIPDPIYATYTHIAGTGGFGGEDDAMLYDGVAYGGQGVATKWCTNTWPAWTIFKTDEPIQPTYYGLVTGGDTFDYPGRNWKTWKIWGANFDEEPNPDDENFDPSTVRNSDKWVLIDEKNNIGSDILHTDNEFESYIYLSLGCTVPYKYFMIEVFEAVSGDLIQMNEFTFYNTGNLMEYREEFASQFEGYNPAERVAYKGFIDEYNEKHEELLTTVNAPDVMKIKNELVDLQAKIEVSADLYEEYDEVYQEVVGADIASPMMSAWQTAYTSENIAPCAQYIRGTHAYIVNDETNEGALKDEELQAEMDYLKWIVQATDPNNECYYILLGGHTVGQWGDGFYGNLIDGIALNTTEIDEETGEEKEVKATKWGGQADANGDTYIIFRTQDKTSPFFYTLTTGNDTQSYPGRNWGTWYIYGANFAGDGEATKDAEGWTLIDKKEDVGQDRLHPVNAQPSYFGFSEEQSEYLYYKIVVTKAYEGTAIQMNEIHFGTPEEFEALKEEYKSNAESFDADTYRAEQALIDEYKVTVPLIDGCTNMEELFAVNYKLETLRDGIESSAALYDKLEAQAAELATLCESLSDSEAKSVLLGYVTGEAAAPSETYPNGVVAYILDEHILNDSVMNAELDFMEELKIAAVAVGYGVGMDITCLIVNPTFEKAGEMLKDEQNNNVGREAEGWNGYIYRTATSANDNDIYAAEFCNVNAKFNVNQTLKDLKNGYYKVTLNAGYRANGDQRSYNHAAMAYANDVVTYVPVIREDMANEETRWKGTYPDTEIYACDVDGSTGDAAVDSVVVGYVIWGCEGAANAFAQGRYAITLVAKVTDGTLTLGVKNEGTQGNEWTGVGNFGLVYLGENADEALAEANACAKDRFVALTELYHVYDPEAGDAEADYPGMANFAAAEKAALAENVNAAPFTYDNLKAIGEIMESIYNTKKGYATLFEATTKVYIKWCDGNHDFESLAEEAVYSTRESLSQGVYDNAEAALAAKAQLYVDFPDYLDITKKSDSVMDPDEYESFTFNLMTEGTKPWIDLKNIYEPLEEDKLIIAFDYASVEAISGGQVLYNTPGLRTDVKENLSELAPTYNPGDAEPVWATAYINVSKGVKQLGLGTGTDHGIRWYICNDATDETVLELAVRKFRFITKEQMKAEGGKPLNGLEGDTNNDGEVDVADATFILNVMADESDDPAADANGDGSVDVADYTYVLNIMADAE